MHRSSARQPQLPQRSVTVRPSSKRSVKTHAVPMEVYEVADLGGFIGGTAATIFAMTLVVSFWALIIAPLSCVADKYGWLGTNICVHGCFAHQYSRSLGTVVSHKAFAGRSAGKKVGEERVYLVGRQVGKWHEVVAGKRRDAAEWSRSGGG